MTTTAPDSLDLPQAGGSPPEPRRRPGVSARVLPFLERYGLVVLFLLVVVFFASWDKSSETFPTVQNIRNVVGNQSVLAIAALAAVIPLIAGQFDFSVGSVVGLSSIATSAALSRFEVPLLGAVLIGIGIGTLVGLVNGLLVARVGVNSFIATLGVATVIAGLIQWYTEGQSIITGIPETLTDVGIGLWFGVPRTLFFLVAVGLGVWYVLGFTPLGRHLHSVGSNAASARLVGLRVERIVLASFVLSGMLAGAAGVLLVARQGGGNPTIGPNFILPAFSAAFLGATAFRPGRFNVPGTILAVFFVAFSVSGLTLSGVEPWIEQVFQGVALVLAVALSTQIVKRRAGA